MFTVVAQRGLQYGLPLIALGSTGSNGLPGIVLQHRARILISDFAAAASGAEQNQYCNDDEA